MQRERKIPPTAIVPSLPLFAAIIPPLRLPSGKDRPLSARGRFVANIHNPELGADFHRAHQTYLQRKRAQWTLALAHTKRLGLGTLYNSSNPYAEQIAAAIRVYQQAIENDWIGMAPRNTKLGEGLHGEVWKTTADDGSGTYAIKMIDIEEPAGNAIAAGEERGVQASYDLQMKASELADSCGADAACASKWKRAASHIIEYFHADYDPNTLPGNFHVVMEYAEGENLEDVGSFLTNSQRLSVFMQIAEVIDLMSTTQLGEDRAWVHRDIKHANIVVQFKMDGDVDIKIVDLGMIVDATHKNGGVARNEYRGSNWHWVPPEQKKSKAQVSRSPDGSVSAFDMYSLGILMTQLHCGLESHLAVTNPDEASEADIVTVARFWATEVGKVVEAITFRDPSARLSPTHVLQLLGAIKARESKFGTGELWGHGHSKRGGSLDREVD